MSPDNMETIVIPEDQWRTSNVLSKFEISYIISTRAEDISKTGVSMLTSDEIEGVQDPADIARRELELRKCPHLVQREIGIIGKKRYIETRDPNKMILGE